MKAVLDRVLGNPRTTSTGVAILCAAVAVVFGADAARAWEDAIVAGGGLAAVVLALMRDPGRTD